MYDAQIKHALLGIIGSPAASVAVFAAILAFVGGILGPWAQLRIGKRQAAASQRAADASMMAARSPGNREIARIRLAWMEKLRTTLSDYHSILMSMKDGDEEKEARILSRLGTELDLLLSQDDPLQKALWDITDRIYQTKSLTERQSMDGDLIKAGRAVLKAEWEKVKSEMH